MTAQQIFSAIIGEDDQYEYQRTPVREHTRQMSPSHEIVIRWYDDGIRTFTHYFGDRESWARWVIVPRKLVNELIQLHRQRYGRRPDSAMSLIPFMTSQHYHGPGRSFANEPRVRRQSRKWVMAYQRGGLDI